MNFIVFFSLFVSISFIYGYINVFNECVMNIEAQSNFDFLGGLYLFVFIIYYLLIQINFKRYIIDNEINFQKEKKFLFENLN